MGVLLLPHTLKNCCKAKTTTEGFGGGNEVRRAIRYQLFVGRADVEAGAREERRNSLRNSLTAGQMEGILGVALAGTAGLEEGVGGMDGDGTRFDSPHSGGASMGLPDDGPSNASYLDGNNKGGGGGGGVLSVIPTVADADDHNHSTVDIHPMGGGTGALWLREQRSLSGSRDSLDLDTNEDENVLDLVLEGPPLADIVSAETCSIFDEKMKPLLAAIPRKFIGLEIVMSIFFFVLLLITYGNTVNPSQYYGNINVAILNRYT